MATIQDIHALERRVYGIVEDYIGRLYEDDDVLVISQDSGEITLDAGSPDELHVCADAEYYRLKELVRIGDGGDTEPDNDKISDIANSWLFLD